MVARTLNQSLNAVRSPVTAATLGFPLHDLPLGSVLCMHTTAVLV